MEGTYGMNCSQHCTCQHGGKCRSNDGHCRCAPGWTGTKCTESMCNEKNKILIILKKN